MTFSDFITKWSTSQAAERANKDAFLIDLCRTLGVEEPHPATDPDHDTYVFEYPVRLAKESGGHTVGFVDLYKKNHFLLEAKQGSEQGSTRLGTARRNTPAWNIAMRAAFGQTLGYARTLDEPPPFLIVTDLGYCFDLYASFDGRGDYRPFPRATDSRFYLSNLEKHADLFRTIFTDPHALDPSKESARVTRQIAAHIANLAKALEQTGEEPELVAQFLMRCLFTMFAEDVELLPDAAFSKGLERWMENPDKFVEELEHLWKTMDDGGTLFGVGRIWKFNGGLFADRTALPLTEKQIWILLKAARADWSEVEPAIFGTLLERALDPKERHRLGAHYTPRAYVERLVGPTIEEPLREEWDLVQAEARRTIEKGKADDDRKAMVEARKPVYAFFDKLCSLRVLDPACGSGNFLFVALDLFKRLENEVLDLLHDLGDESLFNQYGRMVTPEQFLGIEIKPWAKEITELVLWIGWLQWQIRTRGWKTSPQEPILRDYHNIECRDAVLAYDSVEPLLDDDGTPVTRWDGETMKISPVTGEEIPEETARTPVYRYLNPRKAEWPEADYIVGNPPFIGNKRMRIALGDGYVEALREAHADVPETADYVIYWWNHSAHLVRGGSVSRVGLITTNSITHPSGRKLVAKHLNAKKPISLVFAIPDHPWADSETGADVRIAMSVFQQPESSGLLMEVVKEQNADEELPSIHYRSSRGVIHEDFSVGANVSDAVRLAANADISFMGVTLVGDGFRLSAEEAAAVGVLWDGDILRPYLIGRDLARQTADRFVIDLFGLDEVQARRAHPEAYQWLYERVRPMREQNKRKGYREKWWIFGEPRTAMRKALVGLERFIITPETSKFRFFVFADSKLCPDHTLFAIALQEGESLAVLSSRIHAAWASAAGSRMGVGNDLRWRNSTCFEPFPFPVSPGKESDVLNDLGNQLDDHRKRRQELHSDLTITGMYNVLEKLRSGEELTEKDKEIHEKGLVSVLRQIHDELDAAVFDAYGWPHDLSDEEILERLVALNAERAGEESRGLIRWLRPDFQNPEGTRAATQDEIEGLGVAGSGEQGTGSGKAVATSKVAAAKKPWPKDFPSRLTAVRDEFTDHTPLDLPTLTKRFRRARPDQLTETLDSLESLGLLISFGEPKQWKAAR